MKLAIGSKIITGPWGGGNNFIINLNQYLKKKGCEVFFDLKNKNIDIILLTDPREKSQTASFNHFDVYNYIKQVNPDVLVVHRINECDERKNTADVNKQILYANSFSDFSVFISTWLYDLFSNLKRFDESKIICNGANKSIFFSKFKKHFKNEKFKIVTHHWSNHVNKGFEIYKLIDQKLSSDKDFNDKIEFTFIGNLPKNYNFTNTNLIKPLRNIELANEIRKNHAYITGSVNEPGGNHQNEAINCGLPILYLNSGCMKEYCDGYGIEYSKENLFEKINEMVRNHEKFESKISNYKFHSEFTCSEYYELFKKLIIEKEKFLKIRNLPKISILNKIKIKLKRGLL